MKLLKAIVRYRAIFAQVALTSHLTDIHATWEAG